MISPHISRAWRGCIELDARPHFMEILPDWPACNRAAILSCHPFALNILCRASPRGSTSNR